MYHIIRISKMSFSVLFFETDCRVHSKPHVAALQVYTVTEGVSVIKFSTKLVP
jgi:hypothetical protein